MKKIYEGYGYDFEFLGLRSTQINTEPTKASIGSYKDIPPALINSKSMLIILNSKFNCLQLIISAWLNLAMDQATRVSKYVNILIEARQQNEDEFAYIIRKQKLYNINILIYTPCGEGKLELFEQMDDYNKYRKDVRILVWGKGLTGHCALIKTIETLIERPNKSQHNFY